MAPPVDEDDAAALLQLAYRAEVARHSSSQADAVKMRGKLLKAEAALRMAREAGRAAQVEAEETRRRLLSTDAALSKAQDEGRRLKRIATDAKGRADEAEAARRRMEAQLSSTQARRSSKPAAWRSLASA